MPRDDFSSGLAEMNTSQALYCICIMSYKFFLMQRILWTAAGKAYEAWPIYLELSCYIYQTFHLNLIVKAPFFGNDVGHHIQYFLIQRDLASFIQLSSKELGDAIVHILRSEHLKGIMYLKDASAGLNVKPLPLCA